MATVTISAVSKFYGNQCILHDVTLNVEEGEFVGMDPGSSSAQSVLLMLIVIGLTMLQFRYLEKKVHYE